MTVRRAQRQPVRGGAVVFSPDDECDNPGEERPEDPGEEEPAPISPSKLAQLLRKAVAKATDGKDLLQLDTWKDLARQEWEGLLGCAEAAATVAGGRLDAGGVLTILDCAADLTVGFRGEDFLGAARELGLLDEVLRGIQKSPYYGDFVNSLDDLDLLYETGKLDLGSYNVPQILEGSSTAIADNFLSKWGNPSTVPLPGKPSGSWKAEAPDGTVMTRYPSTTGDPGRWTLQFRRPNGTIIKIRFGS